MLLKRLGLKINNRCKIAFWSRFLISAASSIVQNPGSADKTNDLSNWATAMKPQKLFKVCLFTLVDVLLSICVHLWKAAPGSCFDDKARLARFSSSIFFSAEFQNARLCTIQRVQFLEFSAFWKLLFLKEFNSIYYFFSRPLSDNRNDFVAPKEPHVHNLGWSN